MILPRRHVPIPNRTKIDVDLLHARMGHVSTNTLLYASEKNVWQDTQAMSVPSTYCEGCHLAVIP